MNLFIIIAIAWSASALIRMVRDRRRQREAERRYAEQRKVEQMVREDRQRRAEETAARIALEAEQMRQRREQERLAREQEKQAKAQAAAWERQRKEDERRDAQLAKHDERILRLEQKLELAQRDEAHWEEEENRLSCELAGEKAALDYCKSNPLMRGKMDACEKKIAKLTKDHYTAETKLIKARQARELCEMQMTA